MQTTRKRRNAPSTADAADADDDVVFVDDEIVWVPPSAPRHLPAPGRAPPVPTNALAASVAAGRHHAAPAGVPVPQPHAASTATVVQRPANAPIDVDADDEDVCFVPVSAATSGRPPRRRANRATASSATPVTAPRVSAESNIATCGICMDDLCTDKGWLCDRGHFLCRACFSAHVDTALQPGALQRNTDKDGNVRCPSEACGVPFLVASLLLQRNDATQAELQRTASQLERVRMQRFARAEVASALAAQKRQLEAEFERRLAEDDPVERAAIAVHGRIVAEVLTLKCPNAACGAAFVDFNGCYALRCHRCNAGFCAWCLKHWTVGDVHPHVARCKEAPVKSVFAPKNVFDELWKKRRREEVVRRLKAEKNDVRERALVLLAKELRDLGIFISATDLQLGRGYAVATDGLSFSISLG